MVSDRLECTTPGGGTLNYKNLAMIILIMCFIMACSGAEDISSQPPDQPLIPTPTIAVHSARVGENFSLGEGESIWIEKGLFEITVEMVIEDSRCPANVECFWEGNAKVSVWVGEQSYILTLGGLVEGDQNAVDLGDGFVLRLLQIDPYPGTEGAEQAYQISMVLEKETSAPYQYPGAI